jgi:hypothetical protein
MTIEPTPATATERAALVHFKLHFFGAVLALRERLRGTVADLEFLRDYDEELESGGVQTAEEWFACITEWERECPHRLPIRALREAAGLEETAVTMLFTAGLTEEDPRFEAVFATLQGSGAVTPTPALLNSLWPDSRGVARRLVELGLLTGDGAGAGSHATVVGPLVWEALRGEPHPQRAGWARYHRPAELVAIDELILPGALRDTVTHAPPAVRAGAVDAILVRGPAAGGRRTVLGAIARELGLGTLEVAGLERPDDGRWRSVGVVATLLDAMPLVVLDPGPAETIDLPPLEGWKGPIGIVLGRHGGVAGSGLERAVTVTLELPRREERRRHWETALPPGHALDPETLADRYRMTGGNIRRAATMASAEAVLAGRDTTTEEDVRAAASALHRRLLDMLATPVDTAGDWSWLAVRDDTLDELRLLESRCRARERLHAVVGESVGRRLTPGVRALFTGPSGSGKTLAASILASVLGVDLYRLDVSTIVSRYVGETESNLATIFARAEEADVALLLDEGDSLMTGRTAVQSSNDKWANLETNYLLQRLESFEGILIVTTNAGERIDSAFQRRMDVVVDFREPDSVERWSIWRIHLPGEHLVSEALLDDLAARCVLTGGQIRNAVLHASLLAHANGGTITSEYVRAAVVREYRKAGQVCPLLSLLGTDG